MQKDTLRIWRFSRTVFGGLPSVRLDGGLSDETVTADKVYDDDALADIAASGFNAIWVHGLLHNIVSLEPFPELGPRSADHLAALGRLIDRAGRHGLKVFLYMQPPRALPVAWTDFWDRHPDIWGQEAVARDDAGDEIRLRSMCVSAPKVKGWLEGAFAKLGAGLPGLGGVLLITASEFPAHCYTVKTNRNHGWFGKIECSRCAGREPEDVAAEVVSLVERGLHSTLPSADVVAWNWSWGWGPDSQARMVERLSKNVVLMADFERGGIKDIPGRKGHVIDEYSIGYSGPSERFMDAFRMAKERGMGMMAKLQFGTTHELATVVSLPVLGNIYDKADFVRKNDLRGFMGCWNFGNFTSANTVGFNYFLGDDRPSGKKEALEAFAKSYLPGCDTAGMLSAWGLFQEAMDNYPFCIPFLYYGVQNFSLSFTSVFEPGPLRGGASGGSWLNVVNRGDDMSNAITEVFPLDDIIARLGEVARIWDAGCATMAAALAKSTVPEAALELGNALIGGAAWRSARRCYQAYKLRLAWDDSMIPQFVCLLEAELKDLEGVLPSVEADPRQGYHSEAAAWMFDGPSIRAKMEFLKSRISAAGKA